MQQRGLAQGYDPAAITSEQELRLALEDGQPFITLISHIVLSGTMWGPQVGRRLRLILVLAFPPVLPPSLPQTGFLWPQSGVASLLSGPSPPSPREKRAPVVLAHAAPLSGPTPCCCRCPNLPWPLAPGPSPLAPRPMQSLLPSLTGSVRIVGACPQPYGGKCAIDGRGAGGQMGSLC